MSHELLQQAMSMLHISPAAPQQSLPSQVLGSQQSAFTVHGDPPSPQPESKSAADPARAR